MRAALGRKVDLIILNIMLPGINGYEICRRVREDGLDVPIVMLTAKGNESDIVLGLNLGQTTMGPSRSAPRNYSRWPRHSCGADVKRN